MSFAVTAGYVFKAGEVQTSFKTNRANSSSFIADGQTYAFAAGSSGSPSITFSGDTGTGIYHTGPGALALTGSLTISAALKSQATTADIGSGSLPATITNSFTGNGVPTTTVINDNTKNCQNNWVSFGSGGTSNVYLNAITMQGTRASPAAGANGNAFQMNYYTWDGVASTLYGCAQFNMLIDGNQSSSNHGGRYEWLGVAGNTAGGLALWLRLVSGWLQYLPVTAPGSNPGSGVYLYVDSADNKLKARGSSGTVTTLAIP